MDATKENSVLTVDASDLTSAKILECSVKVEPEDVEDEELVIDDHEADEVKYEIEEVEDEAGEEDEDLDIDDPEADENEAGNEDAPEKGRFQKNFSKCETCRRRRTKVRVPTSVLSVTYSRNDGITCDFCGKRFNHI
jgi:hypothetical protein